MMYSKHFSVAVRVNGKILRETQGIVTLPFGAEYEILLKNLNSRRAMVKVAVDGTDATDCTRLILQPNASITLQRFIRNGNMSFGNRFKFIERSAGIEAHRGIGSDDGLVRCEFWAEKERPQEITETIVRRHYIDDYDYWPYPKPWYPRPWRRWNDGPTWGGGSVTLTGGDSGYVGNSQVSASCSVRSTGQATADNLGGNFKKCARDQMQGAQFMGAFNMASNDAGITVPGSESHQEFHHASGFQLESSSTVIILQLRGEVGGIAVETPVTVERKPECSSCGKSNKATNKFCSECGTALQLI
jgi:hypothetical protein